MGARLSLDGDEDGETAEINVTPFIDVMLVLLIIFMVAAPLSTVDIPVELPVASAEAPVRPSEPVFVTIKEDLSIVAGETPVTLEALNFEVGIMTQLNREERIYIRADKSVPYGEVVNVMNTLQREGYVKIGLVGLDETTVAPTDDAATP